MKKISIEEHIELSKAAVVANKAKGNRHGQIISQLYSDPYHFIEELIQNAEDAIARKKQNISGRIKIVINDNDISFYHNGDNFTEQDLMAISTFASTTKNGQPNVNQIGKFGIGFRSVYGITDCPEIHSGKYSFNIYDYEVLNKIKKKQDYDYDTQIILPLKKSLPSHKISKLKDNIFNIDFSLLIFLKYIDEIEIKRDNTTVFITSSLEKVDKNFYKKTIYKTFNGKREEYSFLLFYRNIDSKNEIATAFEIDRYNNFVPQENNFVSVYFPTEFKIEHFIKTHGNFTTTPNRENIPFNIDFAEENLILQDEFESFFAQILHSLSKKNMLFPSFWKQFAWKKKYADPISSSISKSISFFLTFEKSLMGNSNKYFCASELCVAEDNLLIKLLKKEEIGDIFNRKDFLNYKYEENTDFIRFLRQEIKLKIADIDSFAFYIGNKDEFLKSKKIEFFYDFYYLLSQYPKTWDKAHDSRYYSLRYKPIVLDQKKKLIAAFLPSGKSNVFFGKQKKGISCVNEKLTQNEKSLNFLYTLDIQPLPEQLEKAINIDVTFNKTNYLKWWTNLYELYTNAETQVYETIKEKINTIKCVPCLNNENKQIVFEKPNNCYIYSELLKSFFGEFSINFIDEKLIIYLSKNDITYQKINKFFSDIGINNGLKFLEIKKDLCQSKVDELRKNLNIPQIVRETAIDYNIEGLDYFLENPSIMSGIALLKLIENSDFETKNGIYTAESYTQSETINFKPEFLSKLHSAEWLFDTNNTALTPSNMYIKNLHLNYENLDFLSTKTLKLILLQNESISDEEKKILEIIREKKINISDVLLQNKLNKVEFTFTKFLPTKPIFDSFSVTNTSKISPFAEINTFLKFNKNLPQNWEDFMFLEKTIYLNQYLSVSKTDSFYRDLQIINSGYLCSSSNELRHVFVAIKPRAGFDIMLSKNFISIWQEKSNRKNITIFVFDLEDGLCIEVAPKDIEQFITSNKIIFLTTKNLSND